MDTIWYTVGVDKRNGPSGVATTPRGPDQREAALWPSSLSRTQRKNLRAKRRRLVAPVADSGSRATSFARSDRRKLLGASPCARDKRLVGLALVDMRCFDTLRVGCTEDCAGGAGPHRPCCYLAAPLRRLLSQFLVPPLFTEMPRRRVFPEIRLPV